MFRFNVFSASLVEFRLTLSWRIEHVFSNLKVFKLFRRIKMLKHLKMKVS